jgi:hypothetical protein
MLSGSTGEPESSDLCKRWYPDTHLLQKTSIGKISAIERTLRIHSLYYPVFCNPYNNFQQLFSLTCVPLNLPTLFSPGLSRRCFRTNGRTNGRTMAAGASVTWTHCSVLFEVTWGKTVRVRADAPMRPRRHERVCADIHMRPHGHRRVHADATMRPRGRAHLLPLSLPPLPHPLRTQSTVRADAGLHPRGRKIYFLFFIFYLKKFGTCCWPGKRKNYNLQFTIYNLQFSVFNPQNPQTPRAPRASRAKPREEEGFFGLVPLVTHPSSIPLLGGLTPKFLSLSLHSL